MYSICAIFKDEAPYIKEWIEFHKTQGFDTFYLYNNNSSDDFINEINDPCIKLFNWNSLNGSPAQLGAYRDCLNKIKDEKWCAFIDIDEFLFCKDKKIPDFLKQYEDDDIAGIGVNWILYGNNGHKTYSKEGVLKRFTKRDSHINEHIKSILRPICNFNFNDPHYFKPDHPYRIVNENKQTISSPILPGDLISANSIRINHYFVKSEEEFINKIKRGRADSRLKRTMSDFISHNKNDMEDLSALECNTIPAMDNNEDSQESSLHYIGLKHKTDKAIAHDFLPFYEAHLNKYRNKKIRLLEIGIGGIVHSTYISKSYLNDAYMVNGSSLRMWEEYFPNAEILGMDIDKSCLNYVYKTNRVKTIIGDQTDRSFLDSIEGEFDIIIDDGGHTMAQQMISFGCLFKKLKPGGIYIVEDLHTSLMPNYGGNELNKDTALSHVYQLKTSNTIDSNYLLSEEKSRIESYANEVFIHGFYDNPENKDHITSIIKKGHFKMPNIKIEPKLDVKIYQIYYDDKTKKLLDSSFIPYHNEVKDNYFENSVILNIYNKGIECDFVGITSPIFKEKIKLPGADIVKIVNANKNKDVIIYCPNYDNIYGGKRLDIWKYNSNPKSAFYKAAEILNKAKILQFDIFEKDWTYCYCNYWIARKHIFDDYCKTVLKPTIEFFEREEVKDRMRNLIFTHRDKIYPVEVFVLEGLFGTYLSNNNYNIYNHFVK